MTKLTCSQPGLIRLETKSGHGAGKPTTKIIEEIADKWAFLVDNSVSSQRIAN